MYYVEKGLDSIFHHIPVANPLPDDLSVISDGDILIIKNHRPELHDLKIRIFLLNMLDKSCSCITMYSAEYLRFHLGYQAIYYGGDHSIVLENFVIKYSDDKKHIMNSVPDLVIIDEKTILKHPMKNGLVKWFLQFTEVLILTNQKYELPQIEKRLYYYSKNQLDGFSSLIVPRLNDKYKYLLKFELNLIPENTDAFMAVSDHEIGFKFHYRTQSPKLTPVYSEKNLANEITTILNITGGEPQLNYGVKILSDPKHIESFLFIVFAIINKESNDKRLKNKTVIAIFIELPDLVVGTLPRDSSIIDLAYYASYLAKKYSSVLVQEFLDKIKTHSLSRILDLIKSKYNGY